MKSVFYIQFFSPMPLFLRIIIVHFCLIMMKFFLLCFSKVFKVRNGTEATREKWCFIKSNELYKIQIEPFLFLSIACFPFIFPYLEKNKNQVCCFKFGWFIFFLFGETMNLILYDLEYQVII